MTSKKLELYFLNNQINTLSEDIEKAEANIRFASGFPGFGVKTFFEGEDCYIHPTLGNISPTHSKYLTAQKYLPEWKAKREEYLAREKALASA